MPSTPNRLAVAAAIVIAQFIAVAADAHHVSGGMMPTTFLNGLLSGIGHPIIGLDHLAFVVGVGLLAALAGFGLLLPGLFIAAMMVGLAIHFAGANLAYSELLLAISVVLMGIAVCRPRTGRGPWLEGGLFALAGLLHGYAFAESIVGAEPSPLVAYIIGLAATQMAIASAAYYVASARPRAQPMLSPLAVRAAGTLIAVVGVVFAVLATGMAA